MQENGLVLAVLSLPEPTAELMFSHDAQHHSQIFSSFLTAFPMPAPLVTTTTIEGTIS